MSTPRFWAVYQHGMGYTGRTETTHPDYLAVYFQPSPSWPPPAKSLAEPIGIVAPKRDWIDFANFIIDLYEKPGPPPTDDDLIALFAPLDESC